MIPASPAVDNAMSTRSGTLPSASALPPPTGATTSPSAAALASTSATSAALAGVTTDAGRTPSIVGPGAAAATERDPSQCIDAVLLRHLLRERLRPQGAHLAARVALRKHLLRIEHAARVEAVLQSGHRRQVVGGEDERHVAPLLGADAVLAREHAADRDAGAN